MQTFAPDVPVNEDDVYVKLLVEVTHLRVKCGPDRSIKSLFLPRDLARRMILKKQAELAQPPQEDEVELDLEQVEPEEQEEAPAEEHESEAGAPRRKKH